MSKHGTAYTLGQYNEVLAAVQRALPKALDGNDPKKLIPLLQQSGKMIEAGLAQLIRSLDIAPVFSRDMTKEGWELIEDAQSPWPIVIENLELVSFLKEDENLISSKEMCKRAKELDANLGQRHAEYLLNHQKEIPAEWQGFYLVFAGTVWRYRFGNLRVPYLSWLGATWYLNFHWLGVDWPSWARLVRPRK